MREDMDPPRGRFVSSLTFVLFLALCTLATAGSGRRGRIQLSDGQTVEGKISMTAGRQFRIHEGDRLKAVFLERVREVRLTPEKEEMVQKWRFLEAGQTRKERRGKPYAVRHLRAAVILAGGEKVTGHLYTTVLYVETEDGTQKVILYAKQRGKPGGTLEELVYPVRISFTADAEETEGDLRLRLCCADVKEATEVVALTRPGLARLPARGTEKGNEFLLPSTLGEKISLAVKTDGGIVAGWPGPGDKKAASLVEEALEEAKDFFDERRLLGVCRGESGGDVYSLLMLSRRGRTTLAGQRSHPWRLGIWRWKYEEDEGRLMLAGRGYLFRGILAGDERLPHVTLSGTMWNVRQDGDIVVVGK